MKLVPMRRLTWNEPGASSAAPVEKADPFRHLATHLFDAAEDALLLLDTEAKVLAANVTWTVLTGHATGALLERTIYALSEGMEPDGLIDWLAGTFPALTDGTRSRVRFRHGSGFHLDVGLSIEPVRDAGQQLVLWLVRLKAVDPAEPYRAPRRRAAPTRRGE